MQVFAIDYFDRDVRNGLRGQIELKCRLNSVCMCYDPCDSRDQNRYYLIDSNYTNLQNANQDWVVTMFYQIMIVLIEEMATFSDGIYHAIINGVQYTVVEYSYAEYYDFE
ncbi:MAG: hypothetical protein ACRCST_11615 [Turicibacter sp.]